VFGGVLVLLEHGLSEVSVERHEVPLLLAAFALELAVDLHDARVQCAGGVLAQGVRLAFLDHELVRVEHYHLPAAPRIPTLQEVQLEGAHYFAARLQRLHDLRTA